MARPKTAETSVKPSDKYAQSEQAPPGNRDEAAESLGDVEAQDIVEAASEDSFPASDPPAYAGGRIAAETDDDVDRR